MKIDGYCVLYMYVYYEFYIIISKKLLKEGFFFIFDGNLFYRIVIGGKEFVYIV